jgi:hypothetical protein
MIENPLSSVSKSLSHCPTISSLGGLAVDGIGGGWKKLSADIEY